MISNDTDDRLLDTFHVNCLGIASFSPEFELSAIHFHLSKANEFNVVVLKPLTLCRFRKFGKTLAIFADLSRNPCPFIL